LLAGLTGTVPAEVRVRAEVPVLAGGTIQRVAMDALPTLTRVGRAIVEVGAVAVIIAPLAPDRRAERGDHEKRTDQDEQLDNLSPGFHGYLLSNA
jgi:hypothetical protein